MGDCKWLNKYQIYLQDQFNKIRFGTLPETNIVAPKNEGLDEMSFLGKVYCQGRTVSFRDFFTNLLGFLSPLNPKP